MAKKYSPATLDEMLRHILMAAGPWIRTPLDRYRARVIAAEFFAESLKRRAPR